MRVGKVDTTDRVALVAEVGINHEGSRQRAAELIETADAAGADAVKLQTYIPESYAPWGDVPRLEMLRRFHLDFEATVELIDGAARRGIMVFATPFDIESAKFLVSACPIVKVSSGDLTFEPLIAVIAEADVDLIISTGAASMAEVAQSALFVDSVRSSVGSDRSTGVLHCTSLYPAAPSTLNLNAIKTLQERFPQHVVGYSDHSMGISASVLAVALGARIVEKHFTSDHSFSDFRDHSLSLEPKEFAELRARVNEAEEMLGSSEKAVHVDEYSIQRLVRRSLVVARDIKAGETLRHDDLISLRPGTGLSPRELPRVVGRSVLRPLEAGTALSWEDLD